MKLRLRMRLIVLSIGICSFIVSCTSKKEIVPMTSDCNMINAKYASDIAPIIQSSCATNSGCHGTGSLNGPGPLTNYTLISRAAAAIRDAVVSKRMPVGSSLSELQIQKIKCWADSGAPQD